MALSAADNDFANQEEVVRIIAESWAAVNKRAPDGAPGQEEQSQGQGQGQGQSGGYGQQSPAASKKKEEKKSSGWSFWGKSSSSNASKGKENTAGNAQEEETNYQQKKNNGKSFDIPETFTDMVKLNAAMTGANMTYIDIMLDSFDGIVNDIVKTGQLAEQTDILAMRIAKDVVVTGGSSVKISEFKVCLLASMRSLRGSLWDTKHEKAWNWLWESVAAALTESLPLPARYEKPVKRFLMEQCEMKDLREIGMQAWYRMFAIDAAAEGFFKQSNERLIFIAVSAMQFTVKIFAEPTSMHTQMIDLGLKHIMHKVEPKYFPMFIDCLVEEIKTRTDEENVINGIRWGLMVIGSIMGRTVEEGSTPLLMAALDNNVVALKAELGKQARGKRADAMLYA
eukprot:TRINITY_DN11581_c1_g1_i1.p1 TRINITY_DN11581_c1_g1~~TRINITY_DN11581_c1_g1_i1.p1  ORF type:complete len:419 (-),score=108.48 TRINITY_DN11581_c1_g1_i1:408-1595(-)